MSTGEPCDRQTLAEAPGYRVERCSCGIIHVSAGPITMHMKSDACESFTTVLAKAMVVLAQLRKQEARPALHLVKGGPPQAGAAEGGEA